VRVALAPPPRMILMNLPACFAGFEEMRPSRASRAKTQAHDDLVRPFNGPARVPRGAMRWRAWRGPGNPLTLGNTCGALFLAELILGREEVGPSRGHAAARISPLMTDDPGPDRTSSRPAGFELAGPVLWIEAANFFLGDVVGGGRGHMPRPV